MVVFVLGDLGDVNYLMSACRTSLPPYAVPQRVCLVPDMPLNANGKVDRRALQERLIDRTEGNGRTVYSE